MLELQYLRALEAYARIRNRRSDVKGSQLPDEGLKTFARQRKDEIVVAVYMAAQEMTHISPNDLNYTFVGAMGQGSSHALGLALGRPDKKVVVFDGDGSLLMNLGCLVTIANQAPKNYIHCLCENGCYETNGSVLTPRSGQIRFAEMAKTAGYKKTYEISELDGMGKSAAGDPQRRRAGFRYPQSRARRSLSGKLCSSV